MSTSAVALNPNLQSPTAIPPRTSSQLPNRDSALSPPQLSTHPALRPVPETPEASSWLETPSSPGTSPPEHGTDAAHAHARSHPSVPASGPASGPTAISSSPPQGHSRSYSRSHSHSHSQGTIRDRSHSHHRSRSRKATAPDTFMSQMPSAPAAPPDPARFAVDDLPCGGGKKTWTDDKERILTAPFEYLFAHPGKDFRSHIINAFNAWLEVPPESLSIITRTVGMLHTASLLVDDVEDSSLLRRGIPVAHSIFGTAQTINSANYIYFVALQELQRLRNPAAITIFADELVHLHRGQGMDLFWRDSLTCPTEDDYLEMVGNKTGGLFRLGIKLMQAESRSLIDCVPLVNLIGLVFQIRDDYMNLSSPVYNKNKGLCEDLTEGKFSFPIIHSIRSNPSNLQLLNILRQKTTDEEVKRYAVAYMEGTGSFEYTKNVVNVLVKRARDLAEEIDEGRGKTAGIHAILDKLGL